MGADIPAQADPDHVTQWMPTAQNGGSQAAGKPLSDSSLSDVRFLRDSDLLIPD